MSASDTKNPIRALHVLGRLDLGGAERWLMDVVRHCSRDDLAIDVCVTKDQRGAYDQEFETIGGTIHRCLVGRNPWRFASRFGNLLLETEYDVVHSHLYLFSGFVLKAASRAGITRRIAHIHTVKDAKADGLLREWYRRWMQRWIEGYATHVVGPSAAALEALWGPSWEKDARRSVIHNGVAVERFAQPVERAELRRELSLPGTARIVLNVARFIASKRHEFLVDVAKIVTSHDSEVYFVFIGDGERREATISKVKSSGLNERFRFIEAAPDIDRFWLSADAFAFPSSNEGFGIVVAEAAAAGLPVVAQDIPGVREAASACHNVSLLPLETSAEAWSRSLEQALKAGRLADDARIDRLRDFPFTIERSIAALKSLYRAR